MLGLEIVGDFSYGKFGFSRPNLDGNKPGKHQYIARKVRKEVFI